jgi:hypothetical protein
MRKVVVYYRDGMDNYREEYSTGPYTGDYAKDVKRNLALMGCKDFRVEPYKDVA